ncbi:MAG: hypothetical protein ACXWG8_13290 [Usitatibacter sp.]
MQRLIERWAWPGTFMACLLAAGAASLALGQDANWDLKNYHFYNPYAFLNGRLAWDTAPAQVQNYLNPLGDLAFYALVKAHAGPRVIAVLMASTTAIAAYFLLRLAALMFGGLPRREWLLAIAATGAIGLTGAAGTAVIGSTMNEWPSTALLIAALYLASRALVEGGLDNARGFALAGLLAGCAAGLKLTYGVFGAALVLAAAFAGPERIAPRRGAMVAAFMLAGFLATYGFWGAILWREFGNPFFPFFNAIFKSPWWEPVSFFDRNWGPRNAWQAIFFPMMFAQHSRLVGEVAFRDWRLAVLMVVAGLAGLRWIWHRLRPSLQAPAAAPSSLGCAWRMLALFTLASYLLWMKAFSIYRYLVPLELLAGLLVVACALYLLRGVRGRWIAIAILALLIVNTTRRHDWGRIAFGKSYFEVMAPALPPGSLVIIGYSHPMAYAIPFLRPDARFVNPASNFLDDGQANLLRRRIEELVRSHAGPIYSLDHRAPLAKSQSTLVSLGLARDASPCEIVRSNMDTDAMQVCRLRRERP